MGMSPEGLFRLEAKVRQLTARSLLRRETHARSRAAFAVASVLRDLLRRNPTSIDNWPPTSLVRPEIVSQLLRADHAALPTLAVLGAVAGALGHDFEMLFLPNVLLAATPEPAAIDEGWPGVVSVGGADYVAANRGTGPPEPLSAALSEAARQAGTTFSAAARQEFKGDLANYPVWRFLLLTDDAGGKLQLRFVARAADDPEKLGAGGLTTPLRWHGRHGLTRAFID